MLYVEFGILASSLALSAVALALSAFALVRGAPARLENEAREALQVAHQVKLQMESVQAEVTTTLGAVQEERERAIRAQRRASADRVRAEGADGNSGGGGTRDEQLANLRRQAGLI